MKNNIASCVNTVSLTHSWSITLLHAFVERFPCGASPALGWRSSTRAHGSLIRINPTNFGTSPSNNTACVEVKRARRKITTTQISSLMPTSSFICLITPEATSPTTIFSVRYPAERLRTCTLKGSSAKLPLLEQATQILSRQSLSHREELNLKTYVAFLNA